MEVLVVVREAMTRTLPEGSRRRKSQCVDLVLAPARRLPRSSASVFRGAPVRPVVTVLWLFRDLRLDLGERAAQEHRLRIAGDRHLEVEHRAGQLPAAERQLGLAIMD